MTATATTADIATALGTTPRELRKFLRSEARNVGKGSRYALPAGKREVAAMAKRFAAWSEAKAAAKVETEPEVEVEAPEVEGSEQGSDTED